MTNRRKQLLQMLDGGAGGDVKVEAKGGDATAGPAISGAGLVGAGGAGGAGGKKAWRYCRDYH